MIESLSRWAAGARRSLRDVSSSQWAVRLVAAAALLLVLVAVPSTHPVGGFVALLVLVSALIVLVRPEPAGGVAAIVSVGAWFVLASVPVPSLRAVVAAALVLVHLAAVVVASSAPPHARVSAALVRRYGVRVAVLTTVAAFVWLMVRTAQGLPTAPLPVALAGLLVPAVVALALLRGGRRDP